MFCAGANSLPDDNWRFDPRELDAPALLGMGEDLCTCVCVRGFCLVTEGVDLAGLVARVSARCARRQGLSPGHRELLSILINPLLKIQTICTIVYPQFVHTSAFPTGGARSAPISFYGSTGLTGIVGGAGHGFFPFVKSTTICIAFSIP